MKKALRIQQCKQIKVLNCLFSSSGLPVWLLPERSKNLQTQQRNHIVVLKDVALSDSQRCAGGHHADVIPVMPPRVEMGLNAIGIRPSGI